MAHAPTRLHTVSDLKPSLSFDVSGQLNTATAGDSEKPQSRSWQTCADSALEFRSASPSVSRPRSSAEEALSETPSRGVSRPCIRTSLLHELAALTWPCSPTAVSSIKPQEAQTSSSMSDNPALGSKAPHDDAVLQGKHSDTHHEGSNDAQPQNLQVHSNQVSEISALKQQIKLRSQELLAARARFESMLQQLISSKRTAQQLREEIAQLQQHQPSPATEADGSQATQMAAIIYKLEQCMSHEQQNKEKQQQQVQYQMQVLEQRAISEEDQVTEYTQLVVQLLEAAEQQVVLETQLNQATTALAKP